MSGRRVFVAALALFGVARVVSAHLEPPGPEPPVPPGEPLLHVHCEDGLAAGYPCRNVDLLAQLPLASFGAGSANDVWGWTDPETGREYALLGLNIGTAFVDVTEPEAPVYVGLLPTHTRNSLWRSIKVYADHAFVVSEAANHGMQVFSLARLRDVAAPPVTLGEDAHYPFFGNAHNLVIDEASGFAYAVGTRTCSGGLHMVDIRTPLVPLLAGCYALDGYTHDAQCLVYTGPDAEHRGREICFASNEDTLTIVDVTLKSAPHLLSRTGYAGSAYTHQGWLTEDHAHFLIDDELDELRFGHATRTFVWDVSDLDAPLLLGAHDGETPATDHNQYVRGSHVFQANYRAGLRVLRIGDLARLELAEVAFFDSVPESDLVGFAGAWNNYPFFASGVVLVSDIERGLFVLEPDLAAVPECADGLDNDRDGRSDHPEDRGCAGREGASELPRNDAWIDVRPGNAGNPIQTFSRGEIPVALLGSPAYDIDQVDGESLAFGPDAAPLAHRACPHREDVNGDGRLDLVSHHRTEETGIAPGDREACLTGELADGTPFEGCDLVRTLPACGLGFELVVLAPLLRTLRRRAARGAAVPAASTRDPADHRVRSTSAALEQPTGCEGCQESRRSSRIWRGPTRRITA
jgi:choice-of-anchor B domain-containing protein